VRSQDGPLLPVGPDIECAVFAAAHQFEKGDVFVEKKGDSKNSHA
jgi:hypothetical protein